MFDGLFDGVPRVDVLAGPTPFHRWGRLSEQRGGEMWAKRDDLTPVLLGGNKVRKLEYLVGAALRAGANTVVTYGAVQSNHCAQTAAVASRAGLRTVLCLRGRADARVEGNLLLDRMLGADVRFDPGPHDAAGRARWLGNVADELRVAGRRPYVIPYGGSSPVGALGYARAGRELQEQVDATGGDVDVVVVTSSSGGTQAGLVLAQAMGWLRAPVVGVSVDLDADGLAALVHDLATESARAHGLTAPGRKLVEVVDDFRGDGYGVPSAQGRAAADLLLRAEGALADQVYTAKGFGGFLAVAVERATKGGRQVFWHTGGLPAVFATGESS